MELESIRVLAKECGIAFEVIQDDCSYVDAASPMMLVMLVITAGTVEYEELLASSADLRLFQEDLASNQPHSIATQEFQSGLLHWTPLETMPSYLVATLVDRKIKDMDRNTTDTHPLMHRLIRMHPILC